MKLVNGTAIDRFDRYTIVAVWEFDGSNWELLCLERLVRALIRCREQPTKRLVFPVRVDLNQNIKRRRKRNTTVTTPKRQVPANVAEQINQLINRLPGITTKSLAFKLDVSPKVVKKNLLQLESEQRICCQLSAWDGKSYGFHPIKANLSVEEVP